METERLILRKIKRKDCLDFYEYAKEFEVGYFAGWQVVKSLKEAKKRIRMLKRYKIIYAIVLKENNKFIGTITLNKEDNFVYQLGYSLNKNYWGKEIMVEAVTKVLEKIDYKIVKAIVMINNYRSQRVLDKLGFKYFKTFNNYSLDILNKVYSVNCYIKRKEE